MALTAGQQTAIMRAIADQIQREGAALAFTKADLKAAAVAADNWASSASSSYNTAIVNNAPTFGNNATPQQKALLLAYVCLVRAGLL